MLHHDYSFLANLSIGIRCTKDDVGPFGLALSLALPSSSPALWRLYGVKIADNKGKKRMALRAGFAIAVSYVLIGMVSNEYELLLGRAFVGFANGFYPAAMTMVSLSVDEKQVGRALGIFQTGLILGNVVGPFLGGAIESIVGMRPVFYVSGVAVLIATLAVLFFVKEPKLHAVGADEKEQAAHPTKSTSLREDFKAVQQQPVLVRLLWIFFFMQCAIMMLQPILALYVGICKAQWRGCDYFWYHPQYRWISRFFNDQYLGPYWRTKRLL